MMPKNLDDFFEVLDDFFPGEFTSGQIIRAKRKSYKITLLDVEEVTGISQSNLSLYENGKKSLGNVQATKIGLAIGLHPMTILFPSGIQGDHRFDEVTKKAQKLLQKKIPLTKRH